MDTSNTQNKTQTTPLNFKQYQLPFQEKPVMSSRAPNSTRFGISTIHLNQPMFIPQRRIHVHIWYVFVHEWTIFLNGKLLGKCTQSKMDPMGIIKVRFICCIHLYQTDETHGKNWIPSCHVYFWLDSDITRIRLF